VNAKDALLKDIDAFCRKYGFGKSEFGAAAMGYCSFIRQACAHVEMREKTITRAREWMAKYEAGLSKEQHRAIARGPAGGFVTGPEMARLLSLVEAPTSEDDCWLWQGSTGKQGYGQICRRWKQMKAHRVFYEFYIGDIPKGLVIDHLCRNTACVNPLHLEPVTSAENTRRGLRGNSWLRTELKRLPPQKRKPFQEQESSNCRNPAVSAAG